MSDTTNATPSDDLDQELEEAIAGEGPVLLTQGTNVPGIGEQLDSSTSRQERQEEKPDKDAEKPAPPAEDKQEQEEKPEEKPASTVSDRLSKSLERQLSRMLGANEQPQPPKNLETSKREPYKPKVDLDNINPEEGVDVSQLKEDRDKLAESERDAGREEGRHDAVQEITPILQRQQYLNQLEFDKRDVFTKHPKLDPSNKDEFDEEVTNALNSVYMASVGLKLDAQGNVTDIRNPNIRYADFVDAALAIAEHVAAEKAATAAKNVAKQASNAGIRPTTTRGGKPSYVGKTPDQMTDKEWEGGGREYWNEQAMQALGA